MPPAPRILDSHIHLWPHHSTNPAGHAWMAPGGPLTKQFSLSDYLAATSTPSPSSTTTTTTTTTTRPSSSPLRGAIYVETDRTLGPPSTDILRRAAQPLAELAWLRRLVAGTPLPGEAFAPGDGAALLWGLVPWAPVDVPAAELRAYLARAEEAAGPDAWARVKGWRFLVQGIGDEGRFAEVVGSPEWVAALRELGRRGWCFDVGVDARGAGVWQVERVVEACGRVNDGVAAGEEVRFVLNHLCKPDMEQHPTTPAQRDAFDRWSAAIERAARSPHTYMKLSGAFSEMADQDPERPWTPEQVLERMRPWLDRLFQSFPPERIMFGSDWPVCNVRGPGEKLAWRSWVAAVEMILDAYGLTDEQRDRVWYGTAVEAYRLTPPEA